MVQAFDISEVNKLTKQFEQMKKDDEADVRYDGWKALRRIQASVWILIFDNVYLLVYRLINFQEVK